MMTHEVDTVATVNHHHHQSETPNLQLMKQCKGVPTCRAAIGAVSATYEPQADAETTGPVPALGLAPGQGERPVLSKRKQKAVESKKELDRSSKAARSEATPAQKLEERLEEENGYVDESKQSWRAREGGRSAVDGNQRSCSQDGLVNGAKRLGVPVTKKAVDAATLPPVGDTKVGVIVAYARDELGISMLDAKHQARWAFRSSRRPAAPSMPSCRSPTVRSSSRSSTSTATSTSWCMILGTIATPAIHVARSSTTAKTRL